MAADTALSGEPQLPSQPPPAPAAPSERDPLLAGGGLQAPLCGRCLLSLSGPQLLLILFVLFIAYQNRVGQWEAWWGAVVVVISADVLYAAAFISSILFSMCAVYYARLDAFKKNGLCYSLGWLLFLAINLTLCWYSMLKISSLHHVPITCIDRGLCVFDPDGSTEPNLSGLYGLMLSWVWVPTGFLVSVAGAFWRPWLLVGSLLLLVLHLLSLGHIGSWPVGMPWAHWRESIVGSAAWSSLLFCRLVARAYPENADSRFLYLASVVLVLMVTAFFFYVTSEPMVSFWSFIFRAWVRLFTKAGRLYPEEWVALVVMAWMFFRTAFIAASLRFEQWSARKRMEEGLRYALEHPYRAELEQGFGSPRGASFMNTLNRLSSSTDSPQRIGRLKEKQESLAAARQDSLQCSAGGAAALPRICSLKVRRTHLLKDSLRTLCDKPTSELLAKRMIVSFAGEMGVDAGGLTRDWFDSVSRMLAQGADDVKGVSLLALAPDQTLIPRPITDGSGEISDEQEQRFRSLLAVGRFIALAVLREQSLPLSFSLVVCKYLLQVAVGMVDVRQLDPEFYHGRVEQVLKPGGLAEVVAALGEPLTFVSAATEYRPVQEPLKAGGRDIVVTEETVTEYVQLLCEAHLCGGIRREIQCLLRGFWDVLPMELMRNCGVTPRELSVLVSGIARLDPDEWRKHSDGGLSQVHTWFWEIVEELDEERRCLLLQFATGSSRLPPGGFADLKPQFSVTLSPGSCDHLPHAHTCVNQIYLCYYESKEQLRQKLLAALTTAEGFGFA